MCQVKLNVEEIKFSFANLFISQNVTSMQNGCLLQIFFFSLNLIYLMAPPWVFLYPYKRFLRSQVIVCLMVGCTLYMFIYSSNNLLMLLHNFISSRNMEMRNFDFFNWNLIRNSTLMGTQHAEIMYLFGWCVKDDFSVNLLSFFCVLVIASKVCVVGNS